MTERLQKVLAHCGVGSRRECETFIEQGRVEVNGKVVTKLGTKIDPAADEIRVDGERVNLEEKICYLVHKPRGYLCTSKDSHGRPKVIDLVPEERRIYTVGRLDEGSEGLLLLTNDGALANVICHPRYQVDKTYRLTVRGPVDPRALERIERGVWLAEGKSTPARIERVDRKGPNTVVTVTLWEGRNSELRRIFAKVDLRVTHLVRTAIGPLQIQDLPVGGYRRVHPRELEFAFERLHEGWKPKPPPAPRDRGPARPRVRAPEGRPRRP
jgi:23S rRNA pseudouridine2605 synthase